MKTPSEVIVSFENDPAARRDAFRDMKSRLELSTRGQDPKARLNWLFSHLDEFLERWIRILSFYSMSQFVHNDMHLVLLMCVDLGDEEIKDLSRSSQAKWEAFTATLRKIDGHTSKEIGEVLRSQLESARQEILGNTP